MIEKFITIHIIFGLIGALTTPILMRYMFWCFGDSDIDFFCFFNFKNILKTLPLSLLIGVFHIIWWMVWLPVGLLIRLFIWWTELIDIIIE